MHPIHAVPDITKTHMLIQLPQREHLLEGARHGLEGLLQHRHVPLDVLS